MHLDLVKLKLELLFEGINSKTEISKGRKSGAGPAGGRFFTLENNSCVNIPLWPKFVKYSRFLVEKKENEDNKYNLYKNNKFITTLKLISEPKFHKLYTSDKIQMKKIAMLHGKDCLASTIYQKCIYWSQGKACIFCGIELSLSSNATILKKSGKQLSEVIDASIKEGVCKHITLTTGTPNTYDKGADMYIPILKTIKNNFSIPIHIQLEPPQNNKFIDQLYSSGADTIGIHIETFDPSLFPKICPGKSKIGLEKYYETWSRCVDIFGKGQVSSYILIGMWDSFLYLQEGVQSLIKIGVIPFIVPVRPIIGTNIENLYPKYSLSIYNFLKNVKNSLKKHGLDPRRHKAGCVRCGACSIISDF